ncbi:hypothetical protein L7F22_026538 [Adiantum nelumboides]|nr:hypothetical protein [Adiantum nelumboides]
MMAQIAAHNVKVKELEQQLTQAKEELEEQRHANEALIKEKEAMGSQAQPTQINIVETHLHVQLPHMPKMPDMSRSSWHEEEGQELAPGALDVRANITQCIEDMPKGPTKEFLLHEKRVMESTTLAFLQPEEQVKGFGHDSLPLPLMRHKAILWKERMRLTLPRNEDGGYEGPRFRRLQKNRGKISPSPRRVCISEKYHFWQFRLLETFFIALITRDEQELSDFHAINAVFQ